MSDVEVWLDLVWQLHGCGTSVDEPELLTRLGDAVVVQVSAGDAHSAALTGAMLSRQLRTTPCAPHAQASQSYGAG